MSNLGLELALGELRVDFLRAQVGDRYVLEMLQANGGQLGGESSGHIVCLDRTTTGDGIVSALQVLGAAVQSGRSLCELAQGMDKLPQHMVNVPIDRGSDPLADERVGRAVRDLEQRMGKAGRVLLRPSGTEPVLRVMVEGEDADLVRESAMDLAQAVQQICTNDGLGIAASD